MPVPARPSARVACAYALLALSAACGSGGDDDDGGPQPTSITVASGNFGSSRYGTVLAPAPTILVAGASGPMSGVTVTFAVTLGDGTLASTTAVSNASGVATLPAWTLGPAPGENKVRATVGSLARDITAIATAGPPSALTIEAGNNQEWVERATVPVRPAVKVTDGTFGVVGVQVTFAVTGGNGTVSIPQVTSNADGIATVGNWRMGDVGTNTLSASVNGIATPVTFTADAEALVVTNLARVAGDAQVGYANNFAGALPVVEVKNQFDQPAEGVVVTFAVAGGGGTSVGNVDTTGINGLASPGSWRFGPAGAQSLSATAAAASTTFTATTTTAPASQFSIEVRYLGTPPGGSTQAVFTAAANRWSQIIIGDLSDNTANLPLVSVNLDGNITTCSPALAGPAAQIDDMVVFVGVNAFDGPGGILAAATPALSRTAGGTTITGCMFLDEADADNPVLADIILHEMGHVIGIGSNWPDQNLIVGNCPTGSLKPYFIGASTRMAFRGSLTTVFADSIVPVEGSENGLGVTPAPCINGQSDGTRDSHWAEAVLNSELMTGYVEVPGPNPLSAITAASIRDLGYVVNDAASDAFSLLRAPAVRAPGQRIRLHELDLTGRRQVVDRDGSIVRIW